MRPYNEELGDVIWETSDIRAWLNGDFYNEAFSAAERGRIAEVVNRNLDGVYGTKGGNNTTDRVFLLSFAHAGGIGFFSDDADRAAKYNGEAAR